MARAAAARAESESEKAIESIRKDMETGRRLKPEDVQHLTREHQEQIRSKGDDYVRQMVDDAREKLGAFVAGRRARAGLIEGSRVVGRGGSRSDEDARPSPATRAAAVADMRRAAKRLTRPAPSAPRAAQEKSAEAATTRAARASPRKILRMIT